MSGSAAARDVGPVLPHLVRNPARDGRVTRADPTTEDLPVERRVDARGAIS